MYSQHKEVHRKDIMGATCGQEMLTLSETPNFTPFGKFMGSPMHYIYLYITECVSVRTMFTDYK